MTVLINNEYFLHATFQTSRRDSVKFSYIFGVRYQKKYTNINFTKMLSQNLLIYDSHGIVSSRTWTAFFYIDRKVIKNAKFNFLNFQKKKKGTWQKNPQVWSPSDQPQKKKRKKKKKSSAFAYELYNRICSCFAKSRERMIDKNRWNPLSVIHEGNPFYSSEHLRSLSSAFESVKRIKRA